jgi:DNA-binding MarR family transcriptional regulator
MSRPAVSKHIKVLTESKLIKVETDTHDGRQRNCIIQLEALQEIQSYLLKLEEFWQSNIQGLENYLAKKKSSKLT